MEPFSDAVCQPAIWLKSSLTEFYVVREVLCYGAYTLLSTKSTLRSLSSLADAA